MRPLLAAAVFVGILGGLWLYSGFLQHVQSQRQAASRESYQPEPASGDFAVVLTLTFAAEPDAFSLAENPPAVELLLGGETIFARRERVEANEPLRIEPVPGVAVGENRFHLIATPAAGAVRRAAARIEVFRGAEQIAETTGWIEQGSRLDLPLIVDVPPGPGSETSHEHAAEETP